MEDSEVVDLEVVDSVVDTVKGDSGVVDSAVDKEADSEAVDLVVATVKEDSEAVDSAVDTEADSEVVDSAVDTEADSEVVDLVVDTEEDSGVDMANEASEVVDSAVATVDIYRGVNQTITTYINEEKTYTSQGLNRFL